MSDLKPSPFCGRTDIRKAALSNGDWYLCENCAANSGANGVEGWNTRPVEDALQARIAELEKKLERFERFESLEKCMVGYHKFSDNGTTILVCSYVWTEDADAKPNE